MSLKHSISFSSGSLGGFLKVNGTTTSEPGVIVPFGVSQVK